VEGVKVKSIPATLATMSASLSFLDMAHGVHGGR
jgi:hypothetical protein